jgi:hypothetical protein
LEACFIVKDANGQKLGYFYFEEEPAALFGDHPHKGMLRAIRVRQEHQDMTAVLTTLLTLFVALVGPNDTTVYVAPSQVVAIIESHGVGACPTTLTTVNQPVFVCESASEVKRKLEALDSSDCLGREGRGKPD